MNAESVFQSIKDNTLNALNYISESIKSVGSSIGATAGSTLDSGVTSFKETSLGDTFFKNFQMIIITVVILIGGIMYIDFLKMNIDSESSSDNTVEKTITIEPNTSQNIRYIPTDEGWTAPILSMRRELTEGFGSEYSERELENIHTKCSDSFCVLHNKSRSDLENACNSISDQNICATKCCCGWTKYTGHESENDPFMIVNNATSRVTNNLDQKPGKCVAGNSKTPLNNYTPDNQPRDIEYYYYMNKCVNGRGCSR